MWEGYKNYDHYYDVSQLTDFLSEISSSEISVVGGRIKYFNIPASFDIETYSMYTDDGKKFAFMYIWQLGINGSVIIGREW